MLNSIGLANLGVDQYIEDKIPSLNKLQTNVIINIAVSMIDDYLQTLEKLESLVDESEKLLLRQIETEHKYAGYIKRQDVEIEKIRRHEAMKIPSNIDFLKMESLSSELREKLDFHKPATLARAARIKGMTPAALSILLVHSKKGGLGAE